MYSENKLNMLRNSMAEKSRNRQFDNTRNRNTNTNIKHAYGSNNFNTLNSSNNFNNSNYSNNFNQNSQNLQNNQTGINIHTKQQLINYIYSTVELSNFKYKIIEYEADLPLLLKQKHFVSGNFSGSNCLLVFTKIRDKFYSYLIDRKTLSYNQNQVNPENVKLYPVTLRLDNSIYDGSIFDGILIHDPVTKARTFIITDIYTFRGKNMLTDKIQYKIMNLVAYLKANLQVDDKMNNLNVTVNKLYELENIETLLKDIPTMKNYNIKGLSFYPEMSGTKLIFMLDNNVKTKEETNLMNTSNISNKLNNYNANNSTNIHKSNNNYKNTGSSKTNVRYICTSGEPVYATFELKKTKDSDVYKLYLLESETRDGAGKTILKSKKMGIAYIPTATCSALCREAFSKNVDSRVLMKCMFISAKNKWEPVSIDTTSLYPTNIAEIEKKLDILEESCSDDEYD